MKANRILAGVMAISLLATGMLSMDRWQAERSGKQVEIVADYYELKEMANQSDRSIEQWMTDFSSYGVYSVALEEESLKSIKEETKAVDYVTVENLMKQLDWRSSVTEDVASYIEKEGDLYDLVVQTRENEVAMFIESGLGRSLRSNQYKVFKAADRTAFILDGTLDDVTYTTGNMIMDADEKVLERPIDAYGSKLETIGLGFDRKKIQMIQSSGLQVCPRPKTNSKAPEKLVDAFEQDLKAFGMKPSHMIFTGNGVLGYEAENLLALDKLIQMMDRNNIAVGLIEAGNQRGHLEQDGINYLSEASDYNVVRVFPIVKYIQKRYAFYNYKGSEEIENTMYRAVTERNIRSVYFRPFMKNEKIYITEQAEYKRLFESLEKRLGDHGLEYGAAVPFESNYPNVVLRILSALGTLALSLGLIQFFLRLKDKWTLGLFGLGAIGIAGLMFVAPNLTSALMGFLAAIVFPSAAILLFLHKLRLAYTSNEKPALMTILKEGAFCLVIGGLLSTIGGLYIGGMLSQSSYMIEMEYFRGVKASLAAPFAVFGIAYLLKFGFNRKKSEVAQDTFFIQDLWSMINLQIKVLYVIIAGIAGAIAIVYLARSGHESTIQPSDLEMIFRNILEYNMLARPRTKEFLLAFPMVMAAFVIARANIKPLLFPAGLIAVIGFSSIANTFSHLRTPLYLSLIRTGYSVSIGLVIGIVVTVVVWWASKYLQPILRRFENE